MNKEVNFVWQGFFLMLVVAAGVGFIRVLASIRPPEISEKEDNYVIWCGTSMPPKGPVSGEGAKLFIDNCATCHRVDKDMVGPALGGISERVKDRKLLYAWVRNNEAVLKSGNVYFNDLFKKWNKTSMSIFPALTDPEIESILTYIGR